MPEIINTTNKQNEIVSIFGYLIGIRQKFFMDGQDRPPIFDSATYETLDKCHQAKIVRNLCRLRNALMHKKKEIGQQMNNGKPLHNIPEIKEEIAYLESQQIYPIKNTRQQSIIAHILEVNRILSDRVNHCKQFFPEKVDWDYIRNTILMPNGLERSGVTKAVQTYHASLSFYPYFCYLNLTPDKDVIDMNKNILSNDVCFLTLVYKENKDVYQSTTCFSIAEAENSLPFLIDFINAERESLIVFVDCENADPYKLCATLNQLDVIHQRRIQKIVLVDDKKTSTAWKVFQNYVQVPIERIMADRILSSKSIVDQRLIAALATEHFKNNVTSFVIAGSDSDYWGVVSAYTSARFLFLLEDTKCSREFTERLRDVGVRYCVVDSMRSEAATRMKEETIFASFDALVSDALSKVHIKDMFTAAQTDTHTALSKRDLERYMENYLGACKLSIADDGKLMITSNLPKE